MGPNGTPSALRGPQSPAKAHVENPWGNKGFVRSLEVPVCYVREGIRGGRLPVTVNKIIQTVVKTSTSGKSRYPANPMGPNGTPSTLRGPQSPVKAHVENPWENKGERRVHEVPLRDVKDVIRREQIPAIVNQKNLPK